MRICWGSRSNQVLEKTGRNSTKSTIYHCAGRVQECQLLVQTRHGLYHNVKHHNSGGVSQKIILYSPNLTKLRHNSAKVDQIDDNLPARPSMKAPIAGVDVPWSVS